MLADPFRIARSECATVTEASYASDGPSMRQRLPATSPTEHKRCIASTAVNAWHGLGQRGSSGS